MICATCQFDGCYREANRFMTRLLSENEDVFTTMPTTITGIETGHFCDLHAEVIWELWTASNEET
jgi:hypothetical protein